MTAALRFSVVTPCMNMAGYLAETIESVLANLGPGDEYFVVDGGSRDGSAEILRRYDSRLTGWISEPDRGYADAIAKGFASATGDLLCWVNASDVLLGGALATAREQLERTSADMIFGDDFYIDEDSRVIRYSRGYVKSLRSAMLFGGWTPLQEACFWRRAAYQRIGGIDASLRAAADYDLFLRMASRCHTRYVPIAFGAYRRHSGQKGVAESSLYERERSQARQAEMRHQQVDGMRGALLSLWFGAGVRFRHHVRQRFWRLREVQGRPIRELRCGRYWNPR